MKVSLLFILTISYNVIIAQSVDRPTIADALSTFDFLQGEIIQESDTVVYYLKKYKEKPNKLVVFIQGTDANPIFSYKMEDGKPQFYRWFVDDFKQLDSSYTYAIIPKPGMAGLYEDTKITIPHSYYENNYQDYRVNQIDLSIKDIIKTHMSNPEKVIVYGHSEGAAIAAALALQNELITHLGFWSGNVLNNFYEFSLFNRIEALQGTISDSLAHDNIMGMMNWYQAVINEPNSTALDNFGFTNKRWASYENPPIEDLLAIDIPIYTVFGTKDVSTPIETAYLIPIQFMQKRKKNLTFEICIECDHGYVERKGDIEKNHWEEIFNDFIQWSER